MKLFYLVQSDSEECLEAEDQQQLCNMASPGWVPGTYGEEQQTIVGARAVAGQQKLTDGQPVFGGGVQQQEEGEADGQPVPEGNEQQLQGGKADGQPVLEGMEQQQQHWCFERTGSM